MTRKTRGEKLLNHFESSVRYHEIQGSQPTEEWPEIDLDYSLSRANLLTYIHLLESFYEKTTINKKANQ